jgi:translation initiation factor IF-2
MWFWLISAIAGSIIGSATESWFRDTKLGVWFYNKVDRIYTWANKRYGLKLLTDEEDRMKKFPQLSKRLETLESQIKEIQRARFDDWK